MRTMVVQRKLANNNIHEQEALWMIGEEDHEWEYHVVRLVEVL